MSQAIRGWESAFLLTRCKESVFYGWNFTNLLLCPRKPFEYRTAYYSHVFADPADHVARYRSILENEYTQQLHRGRFDNWFDEFQTNITDAVQVVHWDELAQRIGQPDDWSSLYLSQLRSNCGTEAEFAYDASRYRFRLAGVCFDDDCG